MPFRLKNTGATYQHLVNKLFEPFIGKTMEVYIDDIIVKSRTNQPLKNILQRLDASGRLLKCTVELSCYDLVFEPWQAIKAQVLANFLAENATPVEESEPHPRP